MTQYLAAPISTELTRDELRALVELPAEPSVSVYMKMYRSGPEVRQNSVRLKNLLRQGAEQAGRLHTENGTAKSLAAELTRLVDVVDELVAEPQDGLALMIRVGQQRIYKLPIPFDDLVMANSRFHVTPLVEYVQGDGRFLVLAVSQKDVRLLEGNKYSIQEVDVAGLPKNLVDALNIDEYVQSIQFHTEGPMGRNSIKSGGGIYHGHAGGDQGDRKSDISQFFRRLDAALAAHFHNDSAPMVFAGVDYLFPIYQSVNSYRGLVDRAVIGNPEGWSADQLHRSAWEIVEAQFTANRTAAIEQYGTLAAHGQGSDNLMQILAAARVGRVGTLLVARGAREPGVVDAETGDVSLSDGESPACEDLIALASSLTIGSSGAVYLVERAKMPTDSPVAALYRYPERPR